MMQDGAYPSNLKYLTCNEFDNSNTPPRDDLNLKKYFAAVTEPLSFGRLSLNMAEGARFNGFSYMQFKMEMSAVSIRDKASVSTKPLGSWTAGLKSPIEVTQPADMRKLQAAVVYRVYTVVVSLPLHFWRYPIVRWN